MSDGVQLTLGELPLDPEQLSALDAIQRARVYGELKLDFAQRHAAEDAVRLTIRRRYGPSRRDA